MAKQSTVYCAWCRKLIKGPKVPYDAPGITHGICERCLVQQLEAGGDSSK